MQNYLPAALRLLINKLRNKGCNALKEVVIKEKVGKSLTFNVQKTSSSFSSSSTTSLSFS